MSKSRKPKHKTPTASSEPPSIGTPPPEPESTPTPPATPYIPAAATLPVGDPLNHTVTLLLPTEHQPSHNSYGTRPHDQLRIDMTARGPESMALATLRRSMQENAVRIEPGGPVVNSSADVIRYILRQVAEQIAARKKGEPTS